MPSETVYPDSVEHHARKWLAEHGRDDLNVRAFLDLAQRFVFGPTIVDLDVAFDLVLSAVSHYTPRTRVPAWVEVLAAIAVERDKVQRWFVPLRFPVQVPMPSAPRETRSKLRKRAKLTQLDDEHVRIDLSVETDYTIADPNPLVLRGEL